MVIDSVTSLHPMYCMQMSHVPWSVCLVCLLKTPVSPAKTGEPIEMSCWGKGLDSVAHIQILTEKTRAGFKGGGKLGSCPGAASTTKGPPQKNSKNILPKET